MHLSQKPDADLNLHHHDGEPQYWINTITNYFFILRMTKVNMPWQIQPPYLQCLKHMPAASRGLRASKRLISARFVWKKMGSQIAELCRDCQRCARSKASTAVHTPIQHMEMPEKRFSHMHIAHRHREATTCLQPGPHAPLHRGGPKHQHQHQHHSLG